MSINPWDRNTEVHPSHNMNKSPSGFRRPGTTPRFYQIQICQKCGCEVMDHSLGKFTEPKLVVACQEKKHVDKKVMEKKLGIRFSDNDFYNTLHGFFQTFHDGITWNRHDLAGKLTKARIVDLYNSLIPGIYLLFQNGYRDIGHEFDPTYLKITELNVYLDEEVDDYVEELRDTQCGNSEFQYYDYHGTLMAKMTGQVLEPIIVVI